MRATARAAKAVKAVEQDIGQALRDQRQREVAEWHAKRCNIPQLVHGQQIKTTQDQYRPEIFVRSVEGCCRDDIQRFKNTPGASERCQIELGSCYNTAKNNGHKTAWAAKTSACLTADYPGKADELRIKREAYAAALLVEDGGLYSIEGRIYRARYTGPNYSDPVHFDETCFDRIANADFFQQRWEELQAYLNHVLEYAHQQNRERIAEAYDDNIRFCIENLEALRKLGKL